MPTENPKVLFVANDDLLERIDDYRYENRIPSRSKAIRMLIREALKKHEKGKSK